MSPRPTHIDLTPRNPLISQQGPHTPTAREFLPPQHGDVPPPLSPLDAFALQGRMLAQRLEQGAKFDNRISRLPQFYVAAELAKPRPGYSQKQARSRQLTNGKRSSGSRRSKGQSNTKVEDTVPTPALSQPTIRPQSHYPVIHNDEGEVFDDDASSVYSSRSRYMEEEADDDEEMPDEARLAVAQDYFNSWQSKYTTSLPVRRDSAAANSPIAPELPAAPRANLAPVPVSSNIMCPAKAAIAPAKTAGQFLTTYTPPRSPATGFSRMTIRAVSDEGSKPVHFLTSSDRTTSNSTTQTEIRSPVSPLFESPRSPSISSDHSGGASLMPRPHVKVNFSRPISNKNSPRPSFSYDTRPAVVTQSSSEKQPSFDTRPSFRSSTRQIDAYGTDRNVIASFCASPLGIHHPSVETGAFSDDPDDYTDDEDEFAHLPHQTKVLIPISSHIYARYSLSQAIFVPHLDPEQADRRDMSPVSPTPLSPSPTSSAPVYTAVKQFTSIPPAASPRDSPRNRYDALNTAIDSQTPPLPSQQLPQLTPRSSRPQLRLNTSSLSSPSMPAPIPTSTSTPILPTKHIPPLPSAHQSPEAHLALGISLHEQGNLPKSTYHLRLAARAGLADAMLLYALACRHAWGVKRNEAEAVIWLKKAVEVSGVDLAVSGSADTQRQAKAHQTSLALAIFELGMSYLNGWGIEKDAGQALRMFEIAGNLGDADAMVKAAECWRDGVGAKRDMKRAAECVRRAEGMGVVFVGESWTRKEKYCETGRDKQGEVGDRGEKKARALFGLGR